MPHTSDPAGRPALTFPSMGTVVSLRLVGRVAVPGLAARGDALAAVRETFGRWDARFSLYRADSELSRIARGDLRLTDASPQVRDCYALALDWRDRTDGVFTPHRGDGVLDLSGIVKGLAIDEAGGVLAGLGLAGWSINAGGDILVGGRPTPGADWATGIVDPLDRNSVLAGVPLNGALRAVATSGSAERGEHIWTALSGGASPYRQVSVFAADIVTADVLATAIIAGGEKTLDECTDRHSIEVLAVLRDGGLLATPGLRTRAPGRTDGDGAGVLSAPQDGRTVTGAGGASAPTARGGARKMTSDLDAAWPRGPDPGSEGVDEERAVDDSNLTLDSPLSDDNDDDVDAWAADADERPVDLDFDDENRDVDEDEGV